ncbi:MAG: ankyrin repeat domain-containing protein [Alphaproteobacteria bacterium]|nr:ankyrin repeat domain-containing protein [Alphaproteobacteria bacterium]
MEHGRVLATVSSTGVITKYEYDAIGNITREGDIRFKYSDTGQLMSRSVPGSNTKYQYDDYGRMISDGVSILSYDSNTGMMNKLISPNLKAYYYYDNLTRLRKSKKVNGKTILFVLDKNARVIEERELDGSTISKIIWKGQLPSKYIFKNQIYNYLCNNHGDVIALLDKNGKKVNTYEYDIWGKLLKSEETVPNAIRYSHEYYDSESKFYYLRGRYYSPDIRRFTTPDPAEDGINWYVYCGNNPIYCFDPSGYAYYQITEQWGDDYIVKKYYSGSDLQKLYNTKSINEVLLDSAIGFASSLIAKGWLSWVIGIHSFIRTCEDIMDARISDQALEAANTNQGLEIIISTGDGVPTKINFVAAKDVEKGAQKQKSNYICEDRLENIFLKKESQYKPFYLESLKDLINKNVYVQFTDSEKKLALREASSNGYWNIAQYLIEHGALETYENREKLSLLNASIIYERWDVVKCIIKRLFPNRDCGDTSIINGALRKVADTGNFPMVKFLVDYGTTVNPKRNGWPSPLEIASRSGHWDIAKYLVEHGADVCVLDYWFKDSIKSGDLQKVRNFVEQLGVNIDGGPDKYEYGKPLIVSIQNKRFDITKYLVDKGADVSLHHPGNYNPLEWATESANWDIVKYLVEHGVNSSIALQNYVQCPPLVYAIESGNFDIAKLMIDKGADTNAKSKYGRDVQPLSCLINQHEIDEFLMMDMVKYLVEHGADVDVRDYHWKTPLTRAIEYKYWKLATYLVEHGADVDVYVNDSPGNTPLTEAIWYKNFDLAKLIVDKGANSIYQALFYAIKSGSLDMVRYLVEHGADVNERDYDTPLMRASECGNLNIVKYLVECGAKIETPVCDSALKHAIEHHHLDIVKYLLKHGADKSKQYYNWHTPMQIAQYAEYQDIVEYLKSQGAPEY